MKEKDSIPVIMRCSLLDDEKHQLGGARSSRLTWKSPQMEELVLAETKSGGAALPDLATLGS